MFPKKNSSSFSDRDVWPYSSSEESIRTLCDPMLIQNIFDFRSFSYVKSYSYLSESYSKIGDITICGLFFFRMSEAAHRGRTVRVRFVLNNISMLAKIPNVHPPPPKKHPQLCRILCLHRKNKKLFSIVLSTSRNMDTARDPWPAAVVTFNGKEGKGRQNCRLSERMKH